MPLNKLFISLVYSYNIVVIQDFHYKLVSKVLEIEAGFKYKPL